MEPTLFNVLALEPNTVRMDTQMVPGGRYTFWRVRVDGQIFSDTVQPFAASDEEIERYGCRACATPGCGTGWVSVRRAGGSVFWFGTLRETDACRSQEAGMRPGDV